MDISVFKIKTNYAVLINKNSKEKLSKIVELFNS